MSYVLIESRDPFEHGSVLRDYHLARGLARRGPVLLFLVENGVLAGRAGARAPELDGAIGAGVEVLADEFGLRERGVSELRAGVRAASLETVVDRLARGERVLWL